MGSFVKNGKMTKTQNDLFVENEADQWFLRNSLSAVEAVPDDHFILEALKSTVLPQKGSSLDIGGAAGKLSAGFLRIHPEWTCHVIEPSKLAIRAGSKAFPELHFSQGNLGQREPFSHTNQDLVILAGVMSNLDRAILSQAVANVDASLKDQGYLVISDFDSPYPRKNPYIHRPGCFTFKQDYAKIFLTMETYHVIYRKSVSLAGSLTQSEPNDPYDQQWSTTVLQKDLAKRYSTS
jgi:SAM-dependent methyltransferase